MKSIPFETLSNWERLHAYLTYRDGEYEMFSSRFFDELTQLEAYVVARGIIAHISIPHARKFGKGSLKNKCLARINECREHVSLSNISSGDLVEASPRSLLAAARYCLIQEAKESGESPEELFKEYKLDV